MDKKLSLVCYLIMVGLLIAGCKGEAAKPAAVKPPVFVTSDTLLMTHTAEPGSPGTVVSTITPTSNQTALADAVGDSDVYPLSIKGPYFVGRRAYEFVDPSREIRPVGITVWYPAVLPEGSDGSIPMKNAEPDLSGAPYPLILSSTKVAGIFAQHLVSHGFAWVSVNKLDTYDYYNNEVVDQPLDILFALDQVAAVPLEGLGGVIDAENAGVTGYSFDGLNALMMSGARVDADFYLNHCATLDRLDPPPSEFDQKYWCDLSDHWAEFEARAGVRLTTSDDGLWKPMTDPRIRAAMPLAADGWWLFGERGLAAVDRPVLLLLGRNDGYYEENVVIFNHLGVTEKSLIGFAGQGHMMVFDNEMVSRMGHFAVAFFGYYLQGKEELGWYFSQECIEQNADLVWGANWGNKP